MNSFTIATILACIIIGITLIFCIWLITRSRTKHMRMRLQTREDLFYHITEQYGADETFVTFIQSPAGQHFLNTLSNQSSDNMKMNNRILHSLHRGILVIAPGLIITIWAIMVRLPLMFMFGLSLLVIGLGFGISAIIIYHRSMYLENTSRRNSSTPYQT